MVRAQAKHGAPNCPAGCNIDDEAVLAVLDACQDAALLLGSDGRVLAVNRIAEHLLGLDKEALSDVGGSAARDLFDGLAGLFDSLDSGGQARGLLSLRRGDGTVFEAEASLAFFKDAAGRNMAAVTLRERTSIAEIEEKAKNLARFPKENPYPVLRLSGDGAVVYANDSSRALLQYWASGLGRHVPRECLALVEESLKTGEGRRFEAVLPDRTYLLHLAPVRDGGYVNVYGLDISDRKRMEADLEQARRDAELANMKKSRFLANMSHEIRTPMNGVMGMAQLALHVNKDPEVQRYLNLLMNSGKHLTGIINDILDLARVESGKTELASEIFDLQSELEAVLAPLRATAGQAGIGFGLSIGDNCPMRVVGDAGRLRQVMVNLVGNALKFTTEGRVDVRASVAERQEKGVLLRFDVADTGPGVPEEEQERIFEGFVQGQASASSKMGGTGLGLAISCELARLMGGDIRLDSSTGEGSVFRFTAWFGVAREAEKDGGPGLETSASHASGLRVLVVEDDDINQQVAVSMLHVLGHSAAIAGDGRKALDMLANEPFDLVLMDIRMPEMNGVEATRLIRSGQAGSVRPDVPVIALTAYAMKGDRGSFLDAGMDGYISKPLDLEDLRNAIERIGLAKRQGR